MIATKTEATTAACVLVAPLVVTSGFEVVELGFIVVVFGEIVVVTLGDVVEPLVVVEPKSLTGKQLGIIEQVVSTRRLYKK